MIQISLMKTNGPMTEKDTEEWRISDDIPSDEAKENNVKKPQGKLWKGLDSEPEDGMEGDGANNNDHEQDDMQEEMTDEELRKQLIDELEHLLNRVREKAPDYQPPPFTPKRLISFLEENLESFSPDFQLGILEKLRGAINEDLLDIDTWKGMWYMLNYTLEYRGDQFKRRFTGDFETDEWGMDYEFMELVQPFLDFLYKSYFRVETTGVELVPDEGRALLVCNHSGQLPWDAAMVSTAILNEHPSQRMTRTLYDSWLPTVPFLSDVLVRMGQVLANEENGVRLLEQEELVGVFPEGHKGLGKLYKKRYRLARFGRGEFVKMSLRTRSPIIPVSIVGAEETYVSLYNSRILSRLTGLPYFPVSPTFPWLGLFGLIPLPTKWFIDIGEPISIDGYGPGSEDDPLLVSQLRDLVRNRVQEMVYERLVQRRSVLFG
jgi:1-acyl-sn-glycerol-3-phosphate acyltransferase